MEQLKPSRLLRFALAGMLLCFVACASEPVKGGGLFFGGQTVTDDVRTERTLPHDAKGVLVTSIPDGSQLAGSPIRPGDVITEVNGRDVSDYDALLDAVFEAGPSSHVILRVLSQGSTSNVEVVSDVAERWLSIA